MAKQRTISPHTIIESPQLTSLGKVLNTLAALLVTIIGVRYIAQDLIAPILLAIFFVVLTYPLFKWFRNRGYSSGISLLLMILTFFISIYLLVNFITWTYNLIQASLTTYVTGFNKAITQIAPTTPQVSPESVSTYFSNSLNRLSSLIYYFVFIPILSFMILLQIDRFPSKISQNLRLQNPSFERLEKFAHSITLYVIGRLKVNLFTGLLFTITLIIIGIDYPVVWGLFTVILSFIPYIGLVIAGIPPVILALATGGPNLALLVIIDLVVINLVAENLIEPYIQGSTHKISTATVVIALIFWSWLLGFVGAIMAVPLTVLLKTILSDYPETRWVSSLMEGNYEAPTSKPGKQNSLTRFFSRILPHS